MDSSVRFWSKRYKELPFFFNLLSTMSFLSSNFRLGMNSITSQDTSDHLNLLLNFDCTFGIIWETSKKIWFACFYSEGMTGMMTTTQQTEPGTVSPTIHIYYRHAIYCYTVTQPSHYIPCHGSHSTSRILQRRDSTPHPPESSGGYHRFGGRRI